MLLSKVQHLTMHSQQGAHDDGMLRLIGKYDDTLSDVHSTGDLDDMYFRTRCYTTVAFRHVVNFIHIHVI